MIVGTKKGKINSIKIGNFIPSKNEICYPKNWDTDKIINFLNKINYNNFSKYEINLENPDSPIELMEIK